MAPNESHYVKWNKTHKKGCDLINDLISACNLKQKKINTELIEVESRMVVTQGWGEYWERKG